MPAKRRTAKRRNDIPAEALQMVFASGFDLLGELADYGITNDTAAHVAAQDAWPVHGAAFMATWQGTRSQPLPWAVEAFGQPEGTEQPVKHRTAKGRAHRITPEAQDAFDRGDYMGLHRALGLKPWEPSPFDIPGGNPYGPHSSWSVAWPVVAKLRSRLEVSDLD